MNEFKKKLFGIIAYKKKDIDTFPFMENFLIIIDVKTRSHIRHNLRALVKNYNNYFSENTDFRKSNFSYLCEKIFFANVNNKKERKK